MLSPGDMLANGYGQRGFIQTNQRTTLLTIHPNLHALTGCAAKPRAYDAEQSRALNLARAGGIYDMDLRDSEDGTRSYSKGILGPLLDLASLATSFDAPLRHLSGKPPPYPVIYEQGQQLMFKEPNHE